MSELNKKTETIYTNKQTDKSPIRRIMVLIVGLVEVLLGARFIFKLAGANPENTIVNVLYGITNYMVSLFENIFSPITNEGLETTSVFEPGTIIAMVVVAIIAFAIFKLVDQNTSSHKNTKETNTIDHSTLVEKEEI